MKIKEFKPLEKNPFKSKGDKQIEAIGNSIKSFEKMMEIRKIVIDEDNNILGGNKRFFALKRLGYKDIPKKWIDKREDLTEKQKREFIIKDNAHWGSEWDYDLLDEWNIDLEEYGLDLNYNDAFDEEILETKEKEITPFNRTHILFSFKPEIFLKIKKYIEKIKEIDGVEYEQGSN